MNLDFSILPAPVVIALAVLVAAQIALLAISLVVLFRAPRGRLVFERKWPWFLIVVFGNMIGSIVFLAVGRRAAPVDDAQGAEFRGDGVARVVGNLYGDGRG
ncbi:MAG: hypothetical protein LBI84_02850 [Propionibacteriaceae bacterium]|nr:hypothetical protein [Propionibacteriaceae bacterium]